MRKSFMAAVSAVGLTVGLLAVSPGASADTDNTITLRDGDVTVNALTDSGAEFFRDGLHLWGGAGVGVETPVGTEMQETTSGLDYRYVGGTGYKPGVYVELDLGHSDDTGQPDGEVDARLTFEHTYGGDLWLGNVATPAGEELKQAAEAAGMTGGGHGSNWHGTWEEWRSIVTSNTEIANVGVSLGLPGDGVLKWITLDGTEYRFTSDAAPLPVARPKVKWAQNIKVNKRSVRMTVEARQPNGTQATKKGAYYRVQVFNPRTERTVKVGHGRVTADNSDRIRVYPSAALPRAKKALRVQVISYGKRRSNTVFHPSKKSRNHAKADASRKGWD